MWAGLRSQVDEDSVCRCEIVGFGEIRASTIGASEHDEWYNVSINYKDGEGLFYTLFTYKEPPSSFILTILKKTVLTNCSHWSFRLFFPQIYSYIYIYFLNIHFRGSLHKLILYFFWAMGTTRKERLLFKYSGLIYVNLLCQYFCQGLRTRGCVETEAGLCLFENAKQVFKTLGLSKRDTDNEH